MKDWLFLIGAIISETLGTSMLKMSEQFTRPLPSIVCVVGYMLSLYLLSLALRTLPVGIAYGIWGAWHCTDNAHWCVCIQTSSGSPCYYWHCAYHCRSISHQSLFQNAGSLILSEMNSQRLLHIFLIYLAVINVVTFFMYGVDKWKAKKSKWRIREAALWGLAMLGGSIGAWLGMKVWHHKTQHKKFKYGVPAIIIIQLILIGYIFYR